MPSVSSLDEASKALAAAHAQGGRVRIGEDLTTEGLARILEHEEGDLTCTVEAGVRLSTLNEALARAGQRLSLDPPGDPTVGALLATNASGPLRHRFGAPRDLVLGTTLVLADGTIANSGGKVVKNVAGYDLARLVCGSRGRLALIARASFRLHPVPAVARTLVVETDDAANVTAALLASQLQPSALDVLHPRRVVVLFEGTERAVDAQLAAARALVGGEEPAGHVPGPGPGSGPGSGTGGAVWEESRQRQGAATGRARLGHVPGPGPGPGPGSGTGTGPAGAVWEESRQRQGAATGRARFAPGELAAVLETLAEAVVRPAAGVAFTRSSMQSDDRPQALSAGVHKALLERIRRELDPRGVLSA